MIKFMQFLRQRKPLVILFLLFPVMALFADNRFPLTFLPENPKTQYQITFKVPHRTAVEINTRVTQVAEKIFNALQGLISLTSKTYDEKSVFELTFNENMTSNNAYLFLQEKIDRIKLELPRDVEAIEIEQKKEPLLADYSIEFSEPLTATELKKLLSPYFTNIKKTEPELETQSEIVIHFDTEKLYREGVSVSQAVQALKLTGLTIDIGRENGFLVKIGKSFSNIEEIGAIPLSVRGHRPILISDIAKLELKTPPHIENLKIWLDQHQYFNKKISDSFSKSKIQYSVKIISRPYWDHIFENLLHPVLGIFCLVALQSLFFIIAFGRSFNFAVVLLYNGLISVHFLFWKNLFSKSITVLDFHSLLLTLLVGTAIWIALFARLRSYYLPQFKLKKIPKVNIEQATLYALSELLPTMFFLLITLFLLNLPILQTSVNLPSRFLAEGLIYFGIPIVLLISIIMPILTDYKWMLQSNLKITMIDKWITTPMQNRVVLWTFLILAVLLPYSLKKLPIGVSSKVTTDLQSLRGHGQRLDYLVSDTEENKLAIQSLDANDKNLKKIYNVWEFTLSGMRYLPDLNLSMFSPSLSLLKSKSIIGYFENEPVKLSNIEFEDHFADLLIAGKNATQSAKAIGLLAQSKLEIMPSYILRNRMLTADFMIFPETADYANLKSQFGMTLIPTQETQHILAEFKKFELYHLTSLVFFILVVSIYLNSFYRAMIMTLLVVAIQSIVYLIYTLTGKAFHIDSLWFATLPTWFCLFYYSFNARIIDLERERGADRDDSALDVQAQFTPTINFSLIAIYIVLLFMSLSESVFSLPRLGLWNEVFVCTMIAVAMTWLLNLAIIPVLYLNSEEYLDKQIYKLLKLPIIKQIMRKFI